MSDRPLSQREAARLLGILPASLRRMEERGKITAVRDPRGWRFYKISEVRRVLTDRTEYRSATN